MRRRLRAILATGAAGLAAALLLIAGNSLGHYFGWIVPKLSPAALSAMLTPYYRALKPPGDGPFPTALLYSGCDGPKDNLLRWAATLNARGWAAVIVDSHTPRGYADHEIWRLICAGQLFMGSERAGDVLISIDDARRMPFVDPHRIALIGASHGAWAIMDLLALNPPARLPLNLAALPLDSPPDPLAGLVAAILLYPYCGPANRARPDGWTRPLPALFLLGTDDYVAPSGQCVEIADTMKARGLPVQYVRFEGVTHGFDQQEKAPFSTLAFDAEATDRALRLGMQFLDQSGGPVR